jgi:hypothetical protein
VIPLLFNPSPTIKSIFSSHNFNFQALGFHHLSSTNSGTHAYLSTIFNNTMNLISFLLGTIMLVTIALAGGHHSDWKVITPAEFRSSSLLTRTRVAMAIQVLGWRDYRLLPEQGLARP